MQNPFNDESSSWSFMLKVAALHFICRPVINIVNAPYNNSLQVLSNNDKKSNLEYFASVVVYDRRQFIRLATPVRALW